jgi:hypothetical protein
MDAEDGTFKANSKRLIRRAFLIGAFLHVVFLSLSQLSDAATLFLLVFALPGLMVDMSAEMIHPTPIGGVLLAIVATGVNGCAYALGAWLIRLVKLRRKQSTKS